MIRNEKGQIVKGSPNQNKKNELGKRYGRLTVIAQAPNRAKSRHLFWECRCDCGNKTTLDGVSLRNGNTKSCGCLFLEKIRDRKRNKNPFWKGDFCSPHALHEWIINNFPKPTTCEICGKRQGKRNFDWSNKNHRYSRNRADWQYVCRSCHQKYDYAKGLRVSKKVKQLSSQLVGERKV